MDKRKEKQEILAEYFAGGTSTRKLGIKYGYNHVTISRWVMAQKSYGKKQPPKVAGEDLQQEDIPSDLKELQEALRIARLKISLLEAMIDISDEQFGTDIRKKAGTSQS